MKKNLLLILAIGITHLAMAQAKEATLEYQKTQQPAAVIELPYSPEIVEGAIRNQFEKQGSKISTSKGIIQIKNASIETGHENQILDLYFKIDRKSRKEKDMTVVYMAAGHPGENIAVRLPSDRYGFLESQSYLNTITPAIENHSVGLQVVEQTDVLKKADKRYAGLVSDSIDYQKKRLDLEQKIADNSKAQETQRLEQERQRQILEALKARKK